MQEDRPPVLGIVEPLATCYGNTLTAKFVTGNEMVVTAFRPITCTTRDEPSENAGQYPVRIHTLQADFIFDNQVSRSLLAESNSTFGALQMLKRASKNDHLKVSQTYRSIVRACIEKLGETRGEEKNVEKRNHDISIFYSIECAWHLWEILCLQPTPTDVIVPQLLEWIRFHMPAPERRATDLLLMGNDASDSDDYWSTIKALVAHGQLEICRALLRLHKSAANSHFKIADEVLQTFPVYKVQVGSSIQKFRSRLQYWADDTERKVAANTFCIEPELEEMIRLIQGNNDAWDSYISNSQYWYEFLPGYLFYSNPTCKHFELGTIANAWLMRWARVRDVTVNEMDLSILDYLVLKLMESNLSKVLSSIQAIGDSNWFATHLMDLIYHCGELHLYGLEKVGKEIRNSLLFEYGSNLMMRNHLWQLGIIYLEHCSGQGASALELLLTKIPIRNERQALKVIAIAQRKKMYKAEEEICKVWSKKSMDQQRYGNALEWAIRSRDILYITMIADFILKNYTTTGDFLCPDLLANVGAKMFLSPRLIFLVKYFEFYQLYRKRAFVPAAELLVNLLDSKITPEYFWLTLMIDTIPLLECKDQKINVKETVIILNHLESELIPLINKEKARLEKNPDEPFSLLKDYRMENIEELINLMRLGCARNLSRAFILQKKRS